MTQNLRHFKLFEADIATIYEAATARRHQNSLLANRARQGQRLQLSGIRTLSQRLRAHGSEVEERIYPGIGHMSIMLALAPGFRRLAPLLADIARFVTTH